MKKIIIGAVILCLPFVIACGQTNADNLPSIEARFTSVPPVIDGELNDAVWKQSVTAQHFYLYTGEKPASQQTKVFFCYDCENIYVAFACYDSHIAGLKSDNDIFKGDEVELFIDPGRTGDYTHVAVNPEGKIYFALQAGNRNNSVMAATKMYQDRWQVEMAIPFRDIKMPEQKAAAENWGINFCRGNPSVSEYSCWSPTLAGFHNPSKFGMLTGLEKIDFAKIRSTQEEQKNTFVRGLQMETDRTFYDDHHTTMEITVGLKRTAAVKNKKLLVEITDQTGVIRLNTEIKPLLLVNHEKINISSLMYGDYVVTCTLSEGNTVITKNTTKIYRIESWKPYDSVEIKNNIMYVNNEPQLPIVLYLGPVWNQVPYIGKQDIADAAAKGFSVILPMWPFYKEDITPNRDIWLKQFPYAPEFPGMMTFKEILDAAYQENLMVMPYILFWRSEVLNEREIEAGGKMILKYREHPAILCWHSNDETDGWTELNHLTYKLCKEIDPYRPVFLNLINALASNRDATDILSSDPYPVAKKNAIPMTLVSVRADIVREAVKADSDKTCWLVLQMFGSVREGWLRCPTPQEERCMTFLALNHGMKGLAYFTYQNETTRKEYDNPSSPKSLSQKLWDSMKELNRQTKAMSLPYLLGKDIAGFAVSSGKLDICAKEYNDAVYVIVCNTDGQETNVEITSNKLRLPANGEVVFESRTIPVRNNIVKDVFSGYDVHIYKFPLGKP